MSATILYLNATGEISGAECSLLALLDAQDRTRWQPVVVAPDGPLLRDVAARGVQAVPLPLALLRRPHSPAAAWRTLRVLRAGQQALAHLVAELAPALLHANSTPAMLYALRAPIPVIWQVRDLAPLGRLGHQCYRRAARVAAISRAVREDVRQYANDGGAKIALLPPAVDTARFRPAPDRAALRAQLGLPEAPLIGMLAQFVPWKRQHLLLDALERIADRRWHAVLAGADLHHDTAYIASLRARTERPPLAGRVTWLPWQPDAAPVLAALDICALTSHNEPFGRVLVEAMACETAVLAIDEAGPQEIITPGHTGLLAPAEPQALAEALAALLAAPDLRSRLGRQARASVEARYSLQQQRVRLEALYGDLSTTFR